MINEELVKMLFKLYRNRKSSTADFFNTNFNTNLDRYDFMSNLYDNSKYSIHSKIINKSNKTVISFYEMIELLNITDEMISRCLLENI